MGNEAGKTYKETTEQAKLLTKETMEEKSKTQQ